MTRNVTFHNTGGRDDFPAVTERSRLKAQNRAGSSENAEEFMEYYDRVLSRLYQGSDVLSGRRVWLTPVQRAAEIEALAAYRMYESCRHRQPCLCPECRQRFIERSMKTKTKTKTKTEEREDHEAHQFP